MLTENLHTSTHTLQMLMLSKMLMYQQVHAANSAEMKA